MSSNSRWTLDEGGNLIDQPKMGPIHEVVKKFIESSESFKKSESFEEGIGYEHACTKAVAFEFFIFFRIMAF